MCEVEDSYHDHHASLKRNPFYGMYNLPEQGEDPVYDDLVDQQTAVPLKQLADTLQTKKPPIDEETKRRVWYSNSRLGANSLMALWEEGRAMRKKKDGQGTERELENKRRKELVSESQQRLKEGGEENKGEDAMTGKALNDMSHAKNES